MIATKTQYLIFCSIFLFQVHFAHGNNWYQDRLKEFNIHTPEIKWGYPINYDLENENIRGVILLTNEQPYLERLNKITYVGAPTIENAKVIANVLPDFENPFPIYYVAVDTSVQLCELTEFLEELGKLSWEPEIRFISSNGSYLKISYNNASYWTDREEAHPIFCGIRFGSDLLINSRNEILFESSPIQLDEVLKKVKYLSSEF